MAISTLSLNHSAPVSTSESPFSETDRWPKSGNLFPLHVTLQRVCRSALWVEKGPPMGILPRRCHFKHYQIALLSQAFPDPYALHTAVHELPQNSVTGVKDGGLNKIEVHPQCLGRSTCAT